ncbi:MAG TPA: serine/threonine-protein kinase [Kofleriaceae bacterium]|nr:serine/threonine-protein kinase [Kofleriaceae bacterium]
MDCDDIALLLAAVDARTLSAAEDARLQQHVATCATCRELADARSAATTRRQVASVPEHALDGGESFVLPTVDPIVFEPGPEVAHGGMGRVVRARDRRLGREVALKEVLDHAMRQRFEREVAITAQLQHPAIVPIYEAGMWPDGTAFYAMRLVSGGTLAEAIARRETLAERLALLPHAIAVADALAYAHSRRIIHRDLKPGNVLVGEFGETLVIDWGLAKELGRDDPDDPIARPSSPITGELTVAGSVMGTPGFMAPEQAAGEEVDERADVYALGAILYTLLAGTSPQWNVDTEATPAMLVELARVRPARPIGELVPDAPADLRAIVERAMARDPAARFASAKELAEELRRFQAGQLVRSREYSARELIARWVRRHRAVVTASALATIAVLAIGAVSVLGIARSRSAERDARERAEHALAESQLEQGRQILIAGNAAEAAPLIAAAAARLPGDKVARRLVAIAGRDAHRRLARMVGGAAAFSPDGRELAVGRADGSIAIVDALTGAISRELPAHGQRIVHLAYAADGARLAVAARDGATVRDARTGAIALTLGAGEALDARLVGDGYAVAAPRELRVFGPDGSPRAAAPLADPYFIAVSRDRARIVAVTDTEVVVLALPGLARIATLPGDGSRVYAAELTGDGDLVTIDTTATRRWSLASPVPRVLARWGAASTLAWLDDTTLVADGQLIDLRDGAMRAIGRVSPIQANAALAGHVLTGGYDRTLRVWDAARPAQPIAAMPTEAATSRIALDRTGTRAVTIPFGDDAAIELWDVGRLPAPAPIASLAGAVLHLVADRDGRLAVRWQGPGASGTELYDAAHARVGHTVGWPLAYRPGGDELVSDQDGRLIVASARDGRALREVTAAQPIYSCAFSRSGALVATSSSAHVDVRDAASWQVVRGFDTPPGITALAIDDADRVVTGHSDGAVRVWNDRSGALERELAGHAAQVVDLEIRGATLVTGSWDLTTRIWSFPGGAPLATLGHDERPVVDLAMSPDGELIAIADGEAAVGIWDATRGRLLEQLPTSDPLASVVFVDDDRVAVGGSGGHVELFDLALSR